MKKLQKLTKISFFLSFLVTSHIFASNIINPKSIERVEKAIVNIETRIAVSAYLDPGSWRGTGFITDKEQGFIVTNNHVVGGASIGTYFVTFFDGRQVQAKPVYYDLWQDFAILQINPKEMPETIEQIKFSKEPAVTGQEVFVIGSPEGQEFSFHSGYVSTLYEINGMMPQSSYVVNLNSAGGASGSPLLNDKNEAIGVVYGGSKTYTLALHGEYVQSALAALKKGKIPARKHIGILTEQYSLDKAVRHRHFPKTEMDNYIKNFSGARNKAVAVKAILPGAPAENLLKPGDIIWEVEGKSLKGNLAVLDKAMDGVNTDEINLTIFRDGKKLKIAIKLYDINKNKVELLVNFAGATFFQADDLVSSKSGIPLKALAIKNVQTGSSFSSIPVSFAQDYKNIYRLGVQSINEQNVSSLDELIGVIPGAIKQKYVSIRFKNYQPYYPSFAADSTFISAQEDLISDITFDSIDTKPRILKFNPQSTEWVAEDIDATSE